MANRKSFQETLDELTALESQSVTETGSEKLRKSLTGTNNLLAAAAARIASKHNLTGLIPDLTNAFERFMVNPLKSDRGCLAKEAVVKALDMLRCSDTDLFLRGIRHVQMEPAYGKPVDTAPALRILCLSALMRTGYSGIYFETVRCLADPELPVRKAAVSALTELGDESAELLLRSRALSWRSDPEISGDCFSALMKINPERSLGFIGEFIGCGDAAVSEDAALAVGHSRIPEAFEMLLNLYSTSIEHAFKRRLILPMALTLADPAFEFLLSQYRDGSRDIAETAADALKLFASNPERNRRIADIFRERTDLGS